MIENSQKSETQARGCCFFALENTRNARGLFQKNESGGFRNWPGRCHPKSELAVRRDAPFSVMCPGQAIWDLSPCLHTNLPALTNLFWRAFLHPAS